MGQEVDDGQCYVILFFFFMESCYKPILKLFCTHLLFASKKKKKKEINGLGYRVFASSSQKKK